MHFNIKKALLRCVRGGFGQRSTCGPPDHLLAQCWLTGIPMSARAFRAFAGALVFAVATPSPSIACGDTPALGAAIDGLMATGDAQKAHPNIDALRTRIASMARLGDDAQARKLEEEAMQLLGFGKVWLRCGEGTFTWIRIEPKQ